MNSDIPRAKTVIFHSSADTFPHQPETHLPSPSSTCGCFAPCQHFQNDVFVRGVSQKLGTTAVDTCPFLDVFESRGVSKIVFSRGGVEKRAREARCEDVRPEFLILTFLRDSSHETRVLIIDMLLTTRLEHAPGTRINRSRYNVQKRSFRSRSVDNLGR